MPWITVKQTLDLAFQHHQAGRLAEAEPLYRQILAVSPDHADALHMLGVVAHQTRRHDLAIELILRSIAADPRNAVAYSNLGEAYRESGHCDQTTPSGSPTDRLGEAIAAFQRAIALQPNFPEAYNNLGNALAAQGRLDEAIDAFQRGLELRPDYSEACNNLGVALTRQGQLDGAIDAFHQALQSRPGYANALSNLSCALCDRGEIDPAIDAARRALEVAPDHVDAHLNLGKALHFKGLPDEALAEYRRVAEIQPDSVSVKNHLAVVLKATGRLREAIAAYREALALEPNSFMIHSGLIQTLHYSPEATPDSIIAEQQSWNRRLKELVQRSTEPFANEKNPGRPLRIGYVSPDFREHVLGRNIIPLFRHHQRRDFQVICYAAVANPDELTEEFRKHADQWRNIQGLTDDELAKVIRQDGIDILVDLSQHSAGNRLPVFARQPAPLQVSFGGYPEGTGLDTIEFRISDRWLEGEGKVQDAGLKMQDDLPQSVHAASAVYLLASFWCYDPCGANVAINPLPALEHGRITFGSLHHFPKLNEPTLRLWAEVLRRLPESRLVILASQGSHRQRTLDVLLEQGIEAHRIQFVAPCPRGDYLRLYHQLDIVLDTFPYNGHTTNLDALWMGVPVVSRCGQTRVSRGGRSILSNAGLPELVARSDEEFVDIATQLARDLPRLTALRQNLRPQLEATVLMDAPRFARDIEAIYRALWRKWCE